MANYVLDQVLYDIKNFPEPTECVKFISYDGKYPNLCTGTLVLNVNGKEYKFGKESYRDKSLYPIFWYSMGECGFNGNYSCEYTTTGKWAVDDDRLPEELRKYSQEIEDLLNENIERGCCGGCL